MPPLPVIANVFRVTLNWTESTGGQHAANVMHFEDNTHNEAQVATAIDAHVTQTMWATVVGAAQVTSLTVIKLDGTSAGITVAVSGAKWTGEAAGDYAPALACIVKEVTGVRGRANRGRIYLPFQSESDALKGSFDADDINEMNTAWANFLTAMTTAVTLPVVASYDRLHAGASAHATIITSYLAESVGATQRRRQSRLR